MSRNCRMILAFLLFCYWPAMGQEYSYNHYDIQDGLAGSTVYCITQDKDGFIWVGTETGVSRFDGTHFKNFTTDDGLPDIEIIQLFGDSKGRVWMAPFRKSVCYYYKGKIHNQDNDSVLRKLTLEGVTYNFAEDAAGDILIQQQTSLCVIDTQGHALRLDSVDGRPIRNCIVASRSRAGNFNIQVQGTAYELTGTHFRRIAQTQIRDSIAPLVALSPSWLVARRSLDEFVIHSLADGREIRLPFEGKPYRHIFYCILEDSLLFTNKTTGALQYNLYSGESKQYLPGLPVSREFRDESGDLWFCTMGQGIYRLNSNIRTITIPSSAGKYSSIHAIVRIGNDIWVGNNQNLLFGFHMPDLRLTNNPVTTNYSNRVLFIDTVGDKLIYGSDYGFVWMGRKTFREITNRPGGIKSVCKKANSDLLVGYNWGAAVFSGRSLRIIDTLWRERTTAVFARYDTAYIGTLNGLYRVHPDRSVSYLGGKAAFFRQRITAMAGESTGMIWVASGGGGVLGYRNDSVIVTLTRQQGLTSNICRNLFLKGERLWVGTDKGLNVIRLDKPGYPITQYTSKDGLPSDIINVVYADSSMVYVGTPAGLSFFDASKPNVSEDCRLHLLSVFNENRNKIDDTASLSIPYKDKFLRLEFAAISYRSAGDITYHYRMLGVDSTWRETKETFLEYPTLPSGKYELQLQAVNKFGLKSGVLSLRFTVATPWWQSVWLYLLVLAAFLLLTWLLVSLLIRQIRNRQKEAEKINRRMSELEHMALQAQMNPHFIFNCLNSIQQYIFDQDIFAANKYIAGFSRLIRSTLQNSIKDFIPLADEIDYLSGYLSLEKLRFKEKMDYYIEADPELNRGPYVVPPMLIQPYVENSMRHGLRHKLEGRGYIHIKFRSSANCLFVIVEDNGIGRKRAAAFKTREHIEYQSKGMSLTADRVRMMNAKYSDPIRIEVVDLEDDAGQATGTRVVIEFPLFHLFAEND
ncbi:sensor histidine kinase [Puia dinghuensis]|uniref:Signal transduction histidine kinase internal region domain-containing protein n=1 Tax=Puia dinghuensis TaxID=1792502 RepID=A0A8J2U8E2_9BACT|nr:sensor histidine kinase [Puia dinghuensis]GGA86262.1 hypothetical protein GCM10011511_06630 [Puia dinghuensis]